MAREVLRGGVPGVRKSLERMNNKAAESKLPQIKTDPIIALAENLAPRLKAAEWHDRADAALAGLADVDLRDIRSVIAAAEHSARTDETRKLAADLRKGLVERVDSEHRKWLQELATTIHEGRTVRALRLSSRPPKAGSPLPPDIVERLVAVASADLNPTVDQRRWGVVLDSVATSPVRTRVVPAGIPDSPNDQLMTTVRNLGHRVPQIAVLFGVTPTQPKRAKRPPPPPAKAKAAKSDASPKAASSDTTNAKATEAPEGDAADSAVASASS